SPDLQTIVLLSIISAALPCSSGFTPPAPPKPSRKYKELAEKISFYRPYRAIKRLRFQFVGLLLPTAALRL
ncbi:hypothetical protein QMZ20_23310, partial [Serratia bockelmannii]|nr:hypothetical protein [Serratia bockelmannii]